MNKYNCHKCGKNEGIDPEDGFNFIIINKCFRCGEFFCEDHYQGNCCLDCIQYYIENPSLKPRDAIIPIQLNENLIKYIESFKQKGESEK